ncbi:hypothetical protein F4779DRAFT_618565 [Xylariaceae sp. FL0662B]|nr:hypothetical protein F4779DRAFT_618565 [Xylariaceae sp. FL0662B]
MATARQEPTTNVGGRTIWTDKARSDLLVAIIEVAPPSSAAWTEIVRRTQSMGYTYSASSALQHIGKLKRKEITAGRTTSTAPSPAGAAAESGASASSTPKKPRGRATPKSTPTKRKIKREDDEDDDETPSKKKTKASTLSSNMTQTEDDQSMPPPDYNSDED